MSHITLPASAGQDTCARINPVADAVRVLRGRDFAVCKIRPDTKRAYESQWSSRSCEASDFGPDDAFGIQGGWISDGGKPDHALVIIDLDSADAVARADEFLPATGMVEGRAGKPRSHRYYLVPVDSIPTECVSAAPGAVAAATARKLHPGPRTVAVKRPGEGEALRFIGTGGQTVCPPSRHSSGEVREWADPNGEPAVIPYPELRSAFDALAEAIGCRMPTDPRAKKPRTPKQKTAPGSVADTSAEFSEEPEYEPAVNPPANLEAIPTSERCRRYRLYLRKIASSDDLPRSFHGGHDATYRLASIGANDFGLSERREWLFGIISDEINTPLKLLGDAWTDGDLWHKVDEAIEQADHHPKFPFGCKLGRRVNRIENFRWVDTTTRPVQHESVCNECREHHGVRGQEAKPCHEPGYIEVADVRTCRNRDQLRSRSLQGGRRRDRSG